MKPPWVIFVLKQIGGGGEAAQRARDVLDKIPAGARLSGNNEELKHAEEQMRHVPEEGKEAVASAVAALARKVIIDVTPHEAFNILVLRWSAQFAFGILRALCRPSDPIWDIIDDLAEIFPGATIAMGSQSVFKKNWALYAGDPRMARAVHKALEHADEVKGPDGSDLGWWFRDQINELRPIPWPSNGFETLNRPVLYFAHYAALRRLFPNQEAIRDVIAGVFSRPSEKIGEMHVLAVQLLPWVAGELREAIYPLIAKKFGECAFEGPETLRLIDEVLEQLDPLGHYRLRERMYASRDFFANHPWQGYGYADDVIQKVHVFSAQEDFNSKKAGLLAHLLLSQNGKLFNRIWTSQLILSIPDQGLHTLIRFLQFWGSISQEVKDEYLALRVDDLLGDTRIKAAREALGGGFDRIAGQIAEIERAGKDVPERLLAKMEVLTRCRALFRELATADGARREEILAEINEQVLKTWPPKIKPDEEKILLIQNRSKAFVRRLNLEGPRKERVLSFLGRHHDILENSGIRDRFVQFASFADSQGIERLQQVLIAYADDKGARIVEVERPDLKGQRTAHLDYFGKFEKLKKELLARGVDAGQVDPFMDKWKRLWHFQNTGEEQHVSVTHDLERWCKHGEEPCLSCQRLSSKSGNMGPANWNYQFGPNPNASGRPLARILLPQLKLAELREKGKVIARSVLEVTVELRDGRTRLSLLSEIIHPDWNFTAQQRSQFIASICQYAKHLGIARKDVYFADEEEDVTNAPTPLPEEYRIYRDRFRSK